MPFIPISTIDDPRLDVYARLTEPQLRNRLEPERGIFIAESFKVIDRALDAGIRPLSVLMTPEWKERAAATLACIEQAGAAGRVEVLPGGHVRVADIEVTEPASVATSADGEAASDGAADDGVAGVPIFVVLAEELKKLTGFSLTRGILCAMRRPQLPQVEDLLAHARNGEPARRVAVLEGIVDHTNVGAIFRSAAALGVDAVLVTPTCCDPLYRRAVRVSMGTVFQVPWTRLGDDPAEWPEAGLARLHAAGFATAAMALSDDSIPLGDSRLAAEERLALIFGTEGDGLSHRTIEGSTYTVRIPMKHGVDSLNVAAASAVAFWELCRDR